MDLYWIYEAHFKCTLLLKLRSNVLSHSPLHSQVVSGISVLPKDTLLCWLQGLGIELPVFLRGVTVCLITVNINNNTCVLLWFHVNVVALEEQCSSFFQSCCFNLFLMASNNYWQHLWVKKKYLRNTWIFSLAEVHTIKKWTLTQSTTRGRSRNLMFGDFSYPPSLYSLYVPVCC